MLDGGALAPRIDSLGSLKLVCVCECVFESDCELPPPFFLFFLFGSRQPRLSRGMFSSLGVGH